MTAFDDRTRAFEAKFALDHESMFRLSMRAARFMGLWAASRMGMTHHDAGHYAEGIIDADVVTRGREGLLDRVRRDLAAKGIAIGDTQVERAWIDALAKAQTHLVDEVGTA